MKKLSVYLRINLWSYRYKKLPKESISDVGLNAQKELVFKSCLPKETHTCRQKAYPSVSYWHVRTWGPGCGGTTVMRAHLLEEALSQTWAEARVLWDPCWAHPEISTKLLSPARTTAGGNTLAAWRDSLPKQRQLTTVPTSSCESGFSSPQVCCSVDWCPWSTFSLPFPVNFYFILFYFNS